MTIFHLLAYWLGASILVGALAALFVILFSSPLIALLVTTSVVFFGGGAIWFLAILLGNPDYGEG